MQEIIEAIGALWKLTATIAVPISIYLLRGPISKILPNIRRIKRGGTEIELEEPKVLENQEHKGLSVKEPPKEQPLPEQEPLRLEESENETLDYKIFNSIFRREFEEAQKLLTRQIEEDPENKTEHLVNYHELRCNVTNNVSSAKELEKMREQKTYAEHQSSILQTLGRFYVRTDQLALATDRYTESEATARTSKAKVAARAGLIRTLTAGNKTSDAIREAQKAIFSEEHTDNLGILYKVLAGAHQKAGNNTESALALEKCAEFNATEIDDIFSAAYSQADSGFPYRSLQNYKRILTISPENRESRNNYAVLLSELNLPLLSAEQYKAAWEKGNTLAAANLAYRYLNAGLPGAAQKILKEAQKIDGYHANVDSALARLRENAAAEKERIELIQTSSEQHKTLMRNLAEAWLLPSQAALSCGGFWDLGGVTTIMISSNAKGKFSCEWGTKGPTARKLEGFQINRGGKAKFFKGHSSYFLEGYSTPKEIFILLSENGQKLTLLSFDQVDPEILTLTRSSEKKSDNDESSVKGDADS